MSRGGTARPSFVKAHVHPGGRAYDADEQTAVVDQPTDFINKKFFLKNVRLKILPGSVIPLHRHDSAVHAYDVFGSRILGDGTIVHREVKSVAP
jgi:hypothetical protein